MPDTNIVGRLAAGERLLLDGGTGSELQRRGVDVLVGATAEGLGPWSANANVDASETVREVHEDYLRNGADIITSNSFWTSRSRLDPVGLGDEWERYTKAAGGLAVQARDATRPEAYVAGGMAPPCAQGSAGRLDSDVDIVGRDAVFEEFATGAKVLADAGADLILAEYVGHIADLVTCADACATAGLPVFLGVRHVKNDGHLQYGETVEELATALKGHDVAAVLLMCSRPEDISATLPGLREAFDGPVGAYPNIGYQPLAPLSAGSTGNPIERGDYTPARLAEFAGQWIEMGAQIVGGCCATGPEHIDAMRPVVKG